MELGGQASGEQGVSPGISARYNPEGSFSRITAATTASRSTLAATSTWLVVQVQYQADIVWVKFAGTHGQYDRIDVETANDH
ncbi:type II toxin-antitoxin system HigB family toxin [Quisquiliibacterium transsilvanicum]|uniref:Type II toxin-antitoxin system HigB family toxin n=1 Tax=Quisquiliibacterium transsilvanicum TaxID=1549638 RepID=A0A7W8HEC2_9BURK|nr:hypothetical protein [Quisquiliibacterium transsilvanicum]